VSRSHSDQALCGLCYIFAGLGYGFWWLVAVLFLGGLGAATQHPIGSALVTRTFTGARALSAFGTYNFSGDVGKVLLPALAAALLLAMSWRPAYTLLGLLGIAAAIPIFLLAPRLMPEQGLSGEPDAKGSAAEVQAGSSRLGYRILIAFGIADSVIRGALFVLLPFLLIAKGAAVGTAGVALTLVFLGGAFGKLACAWVAQRLGTVATIVVAQTLTAAGILAVLVLPFSFALALLPVLGIALNGVTTVTYGSVPSYAPPERRTHALSVFYTVTIGSAALAPPLSGLAVGAIALLTLATIPLAFGLAEGRPAPGAAQVRGTR
jgi:MFS transporter, FSR family, fosmidomycin resistance protein